MFGKNEEKCTKYEKQTCDKKQPTTDQFSQSLQIYLAEMIYRYYERLYHIFYNLEAAIGIEDVCEAS